MSFVESLRSSHTWTDGADNKESIPFVKPHPPREPSSDKKRRKPRVKSASQETTPPVSANGMLPNEQLSKKFLSNFMTVDSDV